LAFVISSAGHSGVDGVIAQREATGQSQCMPGPPAVSHRGDLITPLATISSQVEVEPYGHSHPGI
jgi:hypothetical protein